MKKVPKISVIIPCYNQEKYIHECLKSLLNQSFKDFEIICVDDGSTDNTLKILKSYKNKFKNIIVLAQQNKSAGTARNAGIQKASGEFLYFMDSDDFLDENAFSVLSDAINKKDVDTYTFNYKTYNDLTQEVEKKRLFKTFTSSFESNKCYYNYRVTSFLENAELFIWSNVAPWNKLYKTSFVKENHLVFDELFSTNDRTFYFSALSKSKNIMIIDFDPINYRINNRNSLTGTYNESKFDNRQMAYSSSKKFIDFQNPIIADSFFKVTVQDFVSFFQKADEENKFNVFLKTIKFFKEIETNNCDSSKSNLNKFGFWFNFFKESEYLLDINREKIVPIVFATNDKYSPYLGVAIQSLIDNCSEDKFYDIYIFESSLSEINRYKLLSMNTKNVHIRTINITPLIKDIPMYSKGYFSVEMYYRIIIPDLLYAYNKVLYLDCDIAIEKDVSLLYDTDISNYIVGGIINKLYTKDMTSYVKNTLKLKTEEYFNSGILLFNIKKFRDFKIKQKCFELIAKYPKLACPDQDVLNLSCNGNVLYLDEKWNFQTGCEGWTDEERYTIHKYIVHYTTGNKPWNTKGLALSEIFWKYARKCCFYEDILTSFINSSLNISSLIKSANVSKNEKFHYFIINEKRQPKYRVINEKKGILSLSRKFFKSWKTNGFKITINLTKAKILYFVNRLLGRVDKYNNSNVKEISKKDYNYYKDLKIKKYPQEIETWYNKIKNENFKIEKPVSFNQKIQWLKIYDSTILKSHLTDKYLAKEYIKKTLGEKYIIKTIGIYDKFEDINFDKLPNQFVIKSTHGSGQIQIVKDKTKLDIKELKNKVNSWLEVNYAFKGGFELHYYNIIPRIIIEEYMEGINDDLYDYKIMCINGKAVFLWVDSNRFVDHRRNLYDTQWNLLPVTYCYKTSDKTIPKPTQLKELLKISEKLAKPFSIVRCDFYILKNGEIKFGELTFTSCSGLDSWNPISYDFEFGKKVILPKKTKFKKLKRNQILKAEKIFLKNINKEGKINE